MGETKIKKLNILGGGFDIIPDCDVKEQPDVKDKYQIPELAEEEKKQLEIANNNFKEYLKNNFYTNKDKKMTFEEFKGSILRHVECRPKQWRFGQAVFNYTEQLYGDVARRAQFEKGVDCFYINEDVPKFIETCYELYIQQNNEEADKEV